MDLGAKAGGEMDNLGTIEERTRIQVDKGALCRINMFKGCEKWDAKGMVKGGEEVGIRIVGGRLSGRHGRRRSNVWESDVQFSIYIDVKPLQVLIKLLNSIKS